MAVILFVGKGWFWCRIGMVDFLRGHLHAWAGGFALGVCFRTLGVGFVVDFCHFGVVFVGIEFCNLLFYGFDLGWWNCLCLLVLW